MPKDHEGWKKHYRELTKTVEGVAKLKTDIHLGRCYSPVAAEEVLMEYEEQQAQEAAEQQRRREYETLKYAKRANHIAWFAAVGSLISGFTAIVALIVSLE